MTAFSGDYPKGSAWAACFPYPFSPGYAAAGIIVETGEGVKKEWIGKKVTHCGKHSQYEVLPLDQIHPVQRQEIPDEEAVFFIIAQIVMRGIRMSGITWGDSAVVFGAGLLGHFAACLSRIAGARPVFSVDTADFRLSRLPDKAGIITINPSKQDQIKIIKEHTRERMADIVFEVTGNAGIIPDEFKVLHDQGRFVIISSPRDKTLFDFHDLCNRPSHTIIGAHNYSHPSAATMENPWTAQRHTELFFDLAADNALQVKEIISHRVSWRQAPEIYHALLRDRSDYLGVIINWE